jgi:hypothetical protein
MHTTGSAHAARARRYRAVGIACRVALPGDKQSPGPLGTASHRSRGMSCHERRQAVPKAAKELPGPIKEGSNIYGTKVGRRGITGLPGSAPGSEGRTRRACCTTSLRPVAGTFPSVVSSVGGCCPATVPWAMRDCRMPGSAAQNKLSFIGWPGVARQSGWGGEVPAGNPCSKTGTHRPAGIEAKVRSFILEAKELPVPQGSNAGYHQMERS